VTKHPYLLVSDTVQAAVEAGQPVVALESTIIAHGMPYPRNVETALRVEGVIKAAGALPATCAIIEGHMVAGLTTDQIEQIGQQGASIPKASRRDMGYLLSQRRSGATTVASTMMIAHAAGIRIFATGGIGGVHRGAQDTFDISADLTELAKTPVAVVSAGVKSILDIGLTLEYLETLGVPVIGYQTDDFPAFYARTSGFGVDFRLDTPTQIARLLAAQWSLAHSGGAIIANPVPNIFAQDPQQIEAVIEAALEAARAAQIKGKHITPFLLSYIERHTKGESLDTNIELVCNNARLAAEVAVELSALA
jgi:pseudouridylate synthase